MEKKIERVDSIPLIIQWLKEMELQEIIDSTYSSHGNWDGISYGQLSVLFITYVLDSLNHRLSGMESWFVKHKSLLKNITGWELSDKEATDDRLGILCEALGECNKKCVEFQERQGKHLIQAYELPTDICRYDTTSFNVYHNSDKTKGGLLSFGHSKDNRPDLLQFKQGLGTLDPAGIPILTETLAGNTADDVCYIPAWRQMVRTIGHSNFLMISDCKAAAIKSRGTIDKEKGFYLFPLPMIGKTPEILKELVSDPPESPQEISLEIESSEEIKIVGKGFEIDKQVENQLEDGQIHIWTERWFVTRSDSHANSQKKGFYARLEKASKALDKLKPYKEETAEALKARTEKIIKKHKVEECILVKIKESIIEEKKYIGKGRPGPNRPYEIVEVRTLKLDYQQDTKVIEEKIALFGWRIFVTNTSKERLSLNQSTRYYRNEWLIERGFHRFKKGCIPALPMFLRIPERIKGLMLLLTVALQLITLIEFTARKQLEKNEDTIAGLVPGNPKMATNRPTTERLLSQFDNLHLFIESNSEGEKGFLLETLSPLQKKILELLKIPEHIYDLTFDHRKFKT